MQRVQTLHIYCWNLGGGESVCFCLGNLFFRSHRYLPHFQRESARSKHQTVQREMLSGTEPVQNMRSVCEVLGRLVVLGHRCAGPSLPPSGSPGPWGDSLPWLVESLRTGRSKEAVAVWCPCLWLSGELPGVQALPPLVLAAASHVPEKEFEDLWGLGN